jgi:hypothetical protein
MGRADPEMNHLHQLADRWFCTDPDGHETAVKEKDKALQKKNLPPVSQQQKQIDRIAARRRNMTAQQDVEEFIGFIFAGIEETFT